MAVETRKRYLLGDLVLEPKARHLSKRGMPVHLTRKPFQVLLYLVEHHDRLVTRRELLDQFWEGHDVYDETLTKCVGAIRKALDDQTESPRFIETHWSEGYRLVCKVVEEQLIPADSAVIEIERTPGFKIVPEEEGNHNALAVDQRIHPLYPLAAPLTLPKPKRFSPHVAIVLTCAFIALIATALYFYRQRAGSSVQPSTPIRSIAVLPLKNLTNDPANEYFSDGMTDSLITALSKVDGLKVTSRGSVLGFKGKEVDPREVGRQLGVAAVLEGSVMKSGETVRVGVRLVSAADGRVLWSSDPQDRALGDIFALQDEVARRVVAGLRLTLGGEGEQRLAKRYTDNVEAYLAYMKGRYFWNKRNGEGLGKAITYFRQAIEIDPNFALAYAGLADSYILKRIYALLQPGETLQQMEAKAKAAAEKALEMDDTLAEAHTSLGLIKTAVGNDEADIEREYKRAIELNPNYATAHHWYALHLNDVHRFDEAITEIRRAREIDPLSVVINSDVGIVYTSARRYDQAIEHFKKAMEMDPNFPDAHAMLGWTYVRKGMYQEGIAEFEKARALFGSPTSQLDGLIYAYGMSGNRSEALKVMAKLQRLTKQHHTQIPWENWVFIHIGLGDHDKAFELLEKAHREGSNVKRQLMGPSLDPLRADPRFQDLQRRVGLAQ
ncbi:MAG: tetratricopeptide repeat protein [Acidobacteria bacterium]|nr:tetratricopeptide repeat protein [Acidobacteriota bacterium]